MRHGSEVGNISAHCDHEDHTADNNLDTHEFGVDLSTMRNYVVVAKSVSFVDHIYSNLLHNEIDCDCYSSFYYHCR